MNLPYIVCVDHIDHSSDELGRFATIAEAKTDILSRYVEFNQRWSEYEYRHDVLGEDFHLETSDIGVGESCLAYIVSERTGAQYLALGVDEGGNIDWEIIKRGEC